MMASCDKCRHFYRTMTNTIGYNPVPHCHLFDDTKQQADVFGKSCFEPRETMKQFQKRVFGKPVEQLDETFRYQLLGRLMMDCEYFLGYGGHDEKHLWAGNVQDHIIAMRELWHSCPYDKKPEWLTWEQMCEYGKLMRQSTESQQ